MPEDMNDIFIDKAPEVVVDEVSKEEIEDSIQHRDSVDEWKWIPQDDDDGRGKICHTCGKETNDLSGNPGLWSLGLPYYGGNGKRRAYHLDCVVKAINKFEENKNV